MVSKVVVVVGVVVRAPTRAPNSDQHQGAVQVCFPPFVPSHVEAPCIRDRKQLAYGTNFEFNVSIRGKVRTCAHTAPPRVSAAALNPELLFTFRDLKQREEPHHGLHTLFKNNLYSHQFSCLFVL